MFSFIFRILGLCVAVAVLGGCGGSPNIAGNCSSRLHSTSNPAQVLPSAAPYNAFGVVVNANGKLLTIYREGQTHALDVGRIVIRQSADGTNWSAPRVIFSDAQYDLRNVAGGVLPSGKMVIFWNRFDVGRQLSAGVFFAQSLDAGGTWTAPSQIASRDNAYGPLILTDAQPAILLSRRVTDLHWELYLHFSNDNGDSWTVSRPVLAPGFDDLPDQEAAFLFVGANRILGFGRNLPGQPLLRFLSGDGGVTWTISESQVAPSAAGGELVSPWLIKVHDEADLWFAERQGGGVLSAVIVDNAGNPQDRRFIFTANFPNFGYPSVTFTAPDTFLAHFYSQVADGTTQIHQVTGRYTVSCE